MKEQHQKNLLIHILIMLICSIIILYSLIFIFVFEFKEKKHNNNFYKTSTLQIKGFNGIQA